MSFLMLFVELGLIRWLGENVVYLSFFTNFVLLGSFLGIGLGFLSSARRGHIGWLPVTLFLLVALVGLFPVEIDRSGSEVIFFGRPDVAGMPIWIMLPLVFVGVVAVLFLIGQGVAREFSKFPPLIAYRLDIIGSIAGIAGFTVLSWLRTPPVVWALVVGVSILALASDRLSKWTAVTLVGFVVVLAAQSLAPQLTWSPYYKIATRQLDNALQIDVNGIPHQEATTVDYRRRNAPVLFLPYQLTEDDPSRVLIVGAGTGNDVAIALEEGATDIDAVEIDPVLFEIGANHHPNEPYQDPAVHPIIDDGRAWMERSEGGYDLILFALPDSLTLVSGASSLRLESFLFTQEAIDQAQALLSTDGVFAMYNFYREDWLIDRLAQTLSKPFGSNLCVVAPRGGSGLALLAGGGNAAAACPVDEARNLAMAPAPVTDDYPFLYIRSPGIPRLYLVVLGALLVASILTISVSGTPLKSVRPNLDLFLMGAAFLLLETKSVVQFALWFGTTWRVNALVFAGVLGSVWAAIEVTRFSRLPRPAVLYAALIVVIAVSWSLPPAALLELSVPVRFVTAVVVTFTPIFVANLVFAQRFAESEDSTSAFGVNLLGAMVGGALEYASLITGYRALALLVGGLYIGAYLSWRSIEGRAIQAAEKALTLEAGGCPICHSGGCWIEYP